MSVRASATPTRSRRADDAARPRVLLDRRVVVVDVDDAVEAMYGRLLAERLFHAIHHLPAVQLCPPQRPRHRVPIRLRLRILVEPEVRELVIGERPTCHTARRERLPREQI